MDVINKQQPQWEKAFESSRSILEEKLFYIKKKNTAEYRIQLYEG